MVNDNAAAAAPAIAVDLRVLPAFAQMESFTVLLTIVMRRDGDLATDC